MDINARMYLNIFLYRGVISFNYYFVHNKLKHFDRQWHSIRCTLNRKQGLHDHKLKNIFFYFISLYMNIILQKFQRFEFVIFTINNEDNTSTIDFYSHSPSTMPIILLF